MNTAFTPSYNASTLEVFAEMVLREKLTRRVYLSKLKAPKEERTAALKTLQAEESNVESMLSSILSSRPAPRQYTAKRY